MSVLNQVYNCLSCNFYLTLKAYVFVLDGSYLFITVCNGSLMLMHQVIYNLVSQLLSNMWKYHDTTMLPKVLCFLLAVDWKAKAHTPLPN